MSSWVDFAQVKQNADFGHVLDFFGLEGEQKGNEIRIACPFHEDTRPSCSINVEKKIFHCWSCSAKGNVLDFVQRYLALGSGGQVSLRTAALQLAEINGQIKEIADPERGFARRKVRNPSNDFDVWEDDNPPQPQKINSTKIEAMERNPPLDFALKLRSNHPALDEASFSKDDRSIFGLGVGSRGLMKNRICFPLHDEEGELIGYAGRWIGREVPEGTARYLFPANFKKSLILYNFHRVFGPQKFNREVKDKKPVVLVEGFRSVIFLHTNHRIPAVATMGTDLSEDQILLLKRAANKVIVLMDSDEAGRQAHVAMTCALAEILPVQAYLLPEDTEVENLDKASLVRLSALLGETFELQEDGTLD